MPNEKLDVFVGITQYLYLSEYELFADSPVFKAHPGINVLIPQVGIDLDHSAGALGPTNNGAGLGDILIGPELQFLPQLDAEGNPWIVHRFEAQFSLPTGEYDPSKDVNPGAGHFYFDPYWSTTVWLTKKFSLSGRFHYLWCADNVACNGDSQPLVIARQ